MKTKIFFLLLFIVPLAPVSIAQQTYSKMHGITESDYSINPEKVNKC